MILFLDNKTLQELDGEVKFFREHLNHPQIIAFNTLEQVEQFIDSTSLDGYSLVVLVADCALLEGKYSSLLFTIRKKFKGLVIAKTNNIQCGKRLVDEKKIDDYYMESEDKEAEVKRLGKAIAVNKNYKKIKENILDIKDAIVKTTELAEQVKG